IPASGFQSLQFRTVEIRMGLKRQQRLRYNQNDYDGALKPDQRKEITALEEEPSLFDRVEKWLERTPFLKMQGFDFWITYKSAVESSLKNDHAIIQQNSTLSEEDRKRNEALLSASLESFQALFNEKAYEEARRKGVWRLSYKAIHAALLIQLYRDQPIFQLPFRFLTAL